MSTLQVFVLTLVVSRSLVLSLKIARAFDVLEWTPELIAKDYFEGNVTIVNGGIPSLFSDPTVDLGSNSETQLLRHYASHRNIRSIVAVVEVHYRIVASKKAGVNSLEDLRNKRIGAIPSTSSEYFVQQYLATAGLEPADYTVVPGLGCLQEPCGSGTLPDMLRKGSIDAIGMWEPSVEISAQALGSDAIVFESDQTVYREIYNIATTTEKLNDPDKRREIILFLKALKRADDIFQNKPDSVILRAAEAVKVNATVLKAAWPVHQWNARVPSDMVDVLVEEDKYVAAYDRRDALTREDVSMLVDSSVLEEASFGGQSQVTCSSPTCSPRSLENIPRGY
ncbi:periplasmic binding protein-like II [Whalleya microplaca]|nr:periplasmic binding protein-like II [Whalleya microplaca]